MLCTIILAYSYNICDDTGREASSATISYVVRRTRVMFVRAMFKHDLSLDCV